jgi:hypothetical protein
VIADDPNDNGGLGFMSRDQFDAAVESVYFRVPKHLIADRLSRLAYADESGVHWPYRSGELSVDLARCHDNPYALR